VILNITLLTVVQQLTLDMSCFLGMCACYQSNVHRHFKMSNSRTRGKYLHGGETGSANAACCCHVRVADTEHDWQV